MALTAVVCDLGGVVLRIDVDRIRASWARRSRLPVSEVMAAYPDEVHDALERDEVSEQHYLEHVRQQLALDGSDEELADDFNQLFLGVEDEVLGLLEQARARGLTVVALSNTNRIHHRVWSRRFAAELAVFDAIHCSHELRARKPEPAAYLQVLEAHGLEAHQACFIDDVPAYVGVAQDLGLHGLRYTDPASLARQLSEAGVLGP